MTTSAQLSHTDLSVEPGTAASLVVTVRNDGDVVDRFRVAPLGVPPEWVSTEPPELSLFPGEQGDLTVRIAPPRSADVVPGPRPFGLQVRSDEDAGGAVVEEGVLDVLPFTAPSVEVQPRTSRARGRGRGRHVLALDNRGNAPLEVRLSGGDRDGLLEVSAHPPVLVVEAGAAVFAGVGVRARTAFWRGPDRTSPFVVEVRGADDELLSVDATFVQQARVPRWLPKAVAAALVLLVLAALLWQGVLRPAIEDEARAAAAAEVGPVEDRLGAAEQQLAAPPADPAPGGGGAPAPTPSAPPPPVPSAGPGGQAPDADPLGTPTSRRLELRAGRQSTSADFADRVFSLTDLLLSNPRGHAGVLTLRRDDDVLLQTDLASFRDLDYHFVSPLVFSPGQSLRVSVDCDEPAGACEAAVLVSGGVREDAGA